MITVYREVEVDVNLDDFDTDELIEELESRGVPFDGSEDPDDIKELIQSIWLKRRQGQDYQRELDDLIYICVGRMA